MYSFKYQPLQKKNIMFKNVSETNIKISGMPEVLQQIKTKLGAPVYDLNLYNMGKASNPVFALWNIESPSAEAFENYFNTYSSNPWFQWNTRKWGTMSDCMNFDDGETLSSLKETETHLEYCITTHSVPASALNKLSRMFPSVEINVANEKFGYSETFKNGIQAAS